MAFDYAAYMKKYRIENAEKIRETKRQYDAEHAVEARIRAAEWAKNNPSKAQTKNQNRRALRKAADGSFSNRDIELIYEQQNGRCAYCGIELNGKYHIDHKNPLSRGGSNWPENLACSCATCNLSKSDKTLEEWLAQLGKPETI